MKKGEMNFKEVGLSITKVSATEFRLGEEDEPISMDDAGEEEAKPQDEVDGEMDGCSLLIKEDRDPAEEDAEDEQTDSVGIHFIHDDVLGSSERKKKRAISCDLLFGKAKVEKKS